jgi:hypothetical protein
MRGLGDVVDFNTGKRRAEAIALLIALPALLLKDDNLIALQVLYDLGLHSRACAEGDIIISTSAHKHIRELEGVTGITLEAVNKQHVVLPNFKLLARYRNNRKHGWSE